MLPVRTYLAEQWFERPEELAQLDQDVLALIAEKSWCARAP